MGSCWASNHVFSLWIACFLLYRDLKTYKTAPTENARAALDKRFVEASAPGAGAGCPLGGGAYPRRLTPAMPMRRPSRRTDRARRLRQPRRGAEFLSDAAVAGSAEPLSCGTGLRCRRAETMSTTRTHGTHSPSE
jgi:hypothetical protein